MDCSAIQGGSGHSDLARHESGKALAKCDARSGLLRETDLIAACARGSKDGSHGESTLRCLSHRPVACVCEASSAVSSKGLGLTVAKIRRGDLTA